MKTAIFAFRAFVFAVGLAMAGSAMPVAAQQAPNPTAQSVNEEKLLEALKPGGTISGRITIPDVKAANLIQPGGQTWRAFHEYRLPLIGGVAILGMLILLAVFLAVRGRIRLAKGFSGQTVTRFPSFDRFVHWMTASCFVVLALTGLNLTFGRSLIIPLLGEETFATLAAYGKIAHNYLAFPFMLGIALMFIIWVKDNIPGRIDLEWIKAGGGLLNNGKHPPAWRFNAGQKGIFWIVMIGGAAMSLSGLHLIFPFEGDNNVGDQQFWVIVHAVLAMLFIAAMLAHAYIGSLGMEGAFEAMGTGEVDVNWASEHHSLWLAEEQKKPPPHAVPAE